LTKWRCRGETLRRRFESRGRTAAAKRGAVILAAAVVAAVAGLLLARALRTNSSATVVVSPGARLTWAPPPCGDATHRCVDLRLSNTGENQQPLLDAETDYRIHLPPVPLEGGLQISGGRNVIIIGGQIDLTVPCSDASSDCHGINVTKPTPGNVFIEGVWIRDPQQTITQSTGDGVDVDDTGANPNTITIENVRIDGISGCSGGPDHADVYQPYAAANGIQRIDHLTATTNCQGLQVDPDLAWSRDHAFPKHIIIKNTNIRVLRNPFSGDENRYAFTFTYDQGCNSGPIVLSNVWLSEPHGHLNGNAVWPDVNEPTRCRAHWDGVRLSFPHTRITGTIMAGTPPQGDFVPAGKAGIDYKSPGYRRSDD
jgi:hypothetical protein